MVVKIYALIWLLLVASSAVLYFTGNSTEITLTVFGFIGATLLASGITLVLPWWVDKKHTWTYEAR
jgi:hypothetical protein